MGLLGAYLAASTLGCSGKSGGTAACNAASSCGGDIVGSWKITSSCFDFGPFESNDESCPGITQTVKDVSTSGAVTYDSDRTYSSSFTFSATVEMKVPASCLNQNGTTVTCAQVQQSLEADTDAGFASVSCTGSSGCTCNSVLAPDTQTESGTYTTSGGVITQTAAGGEPDDSAYCVRGNTLTLSPRDSDSTTKGSITLTRQ